MQNYLHKAIWLLKPNAEFVITNRDYSTIRWDVLEGEAPTQAEIDDAIEQVKANEAQALVDNAQAKSALLNKLGITDDEARLLLS